MTSPAKPAPIRYVLDRETAARWVSAEDVAPDVARAEYLRLCTAGRTCSLSAGAGDVGVRIRVDWVHEATRNPGRRTPRPGGTQPESERKRKVLPIRLDAAATSALETLKARWRLSRSEVVARLLVEATGALAIVSDLAESTEKG